MGRSRSQKSLLTVDGLSALIWCGSPARAAAAGQRSRVWVRWTAALMPPELREIYGEWSYVNVYVLSYGCSRDASHAGTLPVYGTGYLFLILKRRCL